MLWVRASHLYLQIIQVVLKTVTSSRVFFLFPSSSLLGKAANWEWFPFLFLCHFIPVSLPEVCRGGLLVQISALAAEDSDALEAQAWNGFSWDWRGRSECCLAMAALLETSGRGWAGDWCWFFWIPLPLGWRFGGTEGAGSSTEQEPGRLPGGDASTDFCSTPLWLARSEHKRGGNNSAAPASRARR